MRTVKASEIVKGMRVEAEITRENGDRAGIAGGVTEVFVGLCVVLHTDQDSLALPLNHPVTVLAEPEPEWVEGAWYRIGGTVCIRKGRGFYTDAEDDDPRPDVEDVSGLLLGRVLIVDWPGDDVARDLLVEFPEDHMAWTAPAKIGGQKVADAIRTQGGAR